METYTIIIKEKNVYDLFQKVYEQASNKIVSVVIDAIEGRAILTIQK